MAIVLIPALLLAVSVISFAAEPIEEIQGLWIEADDCRCSVRSLDKGSLKDVPVRCYHYFVADRAISGYIRLGGAKDRDTAVSAQRCQTSLSLLNETIRDSFRQIEDSLRDYANSPLGILRNNLPSAVGSITYASGTIEYSKGSRERSTIRVWEEDSSDEPSNYYGVGINFDYSLMVGILIGRREGICSAYRKFLPNELYIGIHDDKRHSKADCESRRYRVLERYIRL